MPRPPKPSTLSLLDEMRFFAEHTSVDLDEFAHVMGMKVNSIYAAARNHGCTDLYDVLARRRAATGEAVRPGAIRL